MLIHGGYGQGSDWFSTPDGRRGWASLFLEQGYEVYVVDRPGQGRNPFQPFVNGNFDAQAPTLERAIAAARGTGSTQWPGTLDAKDPAVFQLLCSMGQPMPNNAQTQAVWRSRGAMLLDDIGPSILITHGDGAAFTWVVAQERPALVKGGVALEPTASAMQVSKPDYAPVLIVTGEASGSNIGDVAGAKRLHLPDENLRGNGPMVMMEKNNREVFLAVLDFGLRRSSSARTSSTARPPILILIRRTPRCASPTKAASGSAAARRCRTAKSRKAKCSFNT